MNPYSKVRYPAIVGDPSFDGLNVDYAPNGNTAPGTPVQNFGQFAESHPEYNQGRIRDPRQESVTYIPGGAGPGGLALPGDVVQQMRDDATKGIAPDRYIPARNFPSYQRTDPPPPKGRFFYQGPDSTVPNRGHTLDPVLGRNLADANPWTKVYG